MREQRTFGIDVPRLPFIFEWAFRYTANTFMLIKDPVNPDVIALIGHVCNCYTKECPTDHLLHTCPTCGLCKGWNL